LEVAHPQAEAAREGLTAFAELVKSPEHLHTYRITALSLWNASASGHSAASVLEHLARFSRYPVPQVVQAFIHEQMARFGRLTLVTQDGDLYLEADEPSLLTDLLNRTALKPLLGARISPRRAAIDPLHRGVLKQALAKVGWPLDDRAGFQPGAPLALSLRPIDTAGEPFALRPYQVAAVDAFWGHGQAGAGSGVIVLPCGAGKTLVGVGVMTHVQAHTLILTTSVAAIHQWRRELLTRTTLTADDIGEYTSATKSIRPVTLTTYQMLSHRSHGTYPHFEVMDRGDFGLIIYDEVHLLPAPIFRLTASIQARRRLGLTATLVREDNHAEDVFSLIGPKRFDMPWRELETQGWIAPAVCHEIRVDMPDITRDVYAAAEDREQVRIAAENPAKTAVVDQLLEQHANDLVLVIGQYLGQLKDLADHLDAPLITGQTPLGTRESLYEAFRQGQIRRLVVSKVANFAIDLPDANVAVQVSGTFGSRQEEAQRLGRILRPKRDGGQAYFYTVVSQDTVELQFAQKRQLFLTEQGYRYRIGYADRRGAPKSLTAVIPFGARAAEHSDLR
jgi:DNA excision repair protein ERCC-3